MPRLQTNQVTDRFIVVLKILMALGSLNTTQGPLRYEPTKSHSACFSTKLSASADAGYSVDRSSSKKGGSRVLKCLLTSCLPSLRNGYYRYPTTLTSSLPTQRRRNTFLGGTTSMARGSFGQSAWFSANTPRANLSKACFKWSFTLQKV